MSCYDDSFDEDQLNSFESQKKYYENKINQNENWILINKIHFFLKMNIIQKQVMQCFILLVVKTIMFLWPAFLFA